MSQQQAFSGGNSPVTPDIEFLRGNDGVAVGPNPATFITELVGNTAQGVSTSGNAVTYTETITVRDATAAATSGAALKGVSSYNSADFTVTSGYVSLNNSLSGTGQTIGAVNADIITLPLGATPGTYVFTCSVAGFESTTPAGAGYQIIGSVRTTGAAATLVGSPDKISHEEAAITAGDADIVVSANSAIVRVLGVAGLTIDWGARLGYIFRS